MNENCTCQPSPWDPEPQVPSGLRHIKPGDLVIRTGNRYRPDEELVVARVGRRWIYVRYPQFDYELNERYDIDTGAEELPSWNVLLTPEQHVQERERDGLVRDLRLEGIEVSSYRRNLTVAQLRALLAVFR